jgi:hypothetical protein
MAGLVGAAYFALPRTPMAVSKIGEPPPLLALGWEGFMDRVLHPSNEELPPQASRLRVRIIGIALIVAWWALVSELGSAYGLWVLRNRPSFHLALVAILERGRHWLVTRKEPAAPSLEDRWSEPSPLFVPDSILGFTIRPGRYQIWVRGPSNDTLQFIATVEGDSSRATSYDRRTNRGPEILVYGDSYIWGLDNDDVTTFPWMLQELLPAFHVVNLAQNGYGTVHALLQMQTHRERVKDAALVVLVYGSYIDERNVPTPSRLRAYRKAYRRTHEGDFQAFTHPSATVTDAGQLVVSHVRLWCDSSNAACQGPNPPKAEQQHVTIKLLERIRALRPGPIVLAYIEGPDDSPVLAAAHGLGYTIADIRPRPGHYEWDTFGSLDPYHPGPVAESKFAYKLAAVVRRLVAVDCRSTPCMPQKGQVAETVGPTSPVPR